VNHGFPSDTQYAAMKSLLKEYGIIAVLIVVAVGGYLLVDRNKEDILSYSLDAVGTRLVSLVDDEESKRQIARAFDSFKRRVANDEVSSEQVELVAANILNLSTSGARITPEDAELILNLNEEALLADLPAPEPPDAGSTMSVGRSDTAPSVPEPDSPERPARPAEPARPSEFRIDARALATRIESMVGVAEAMERTIRIDSVARRHVLFSPSNGLHVEIDPETGRHDVRIDVESIRAAAEAAATGESVDMVRIDRNTAQQQVAWGQFLERHRQEMAEFEQKFEIHSVELVRTIERLERLADLQDKGLYAPFDTSRFSLRMNEVMKGLRTQSDRRTELEIPPTDSGSR